MALKYFIFISGLALLTGSAAQADSLSSPTPHYAGPGAEITEGMTGHGNLPVTHSNPADANYNDRSPDVIVHQREQAVTAQRLRHENEQLRADRRYKIRFND